MNTDICRFERCINISKKIKSNDIITLYKIPDWARMSHIDFKVLKSEVNLISIKEIDEFNDRIILAGE